jgi:hypothetical protein
MNSGNATRPISPNNMRPVYEAVRRHMGRLSYMELGTSMVSVLSVSLNSTIHLKSTQFTAEQRERVLAVWNRTRPSYQEDRVVVDFCLKVVTIHHLLLAINAIHKLKGICDAKQFEKVSKKVDEYSVEALTEVMYENTGIAYMKCMARAYLEVNLKESWQKEKWWLDPAYEYGFTDEGLKKITYDKRKRFHELFESVVRDMQSLREKYPDGNKLYEEYARVSELAEEAQAQCLANRNIAFEKMIDMKDIKVAYMLMQDL